MINIDDRVDLVPGNERASSMFEPRRASSKTGPLGRLIAIGGAQVTVQFVADLSSSREGGADVTVGSFLGIKTESALVIGALCDISTEGTVCDQNGAIGHIDLLGEIVLDAAGEPRFHRGIMVYPTLGAMVVPIGLDELEIIFDSANPRTIEVGHLLQNGSIGAYVDVDEMVRKHFAIIGSTGAGKSTSLALILRKLMETRGDMRILLLDAHNEYGNCFDDRAHIVGPGNLRLPFWLFNFDEIVQIIFGQQTRAEQEVSLLAELIPAAKGEYARSRATVRSSYRQSEPDGGRYTIDTPVPYRMEHLIALAESRMGKLGNADIAVRYQRLIMRINSVRKNPRYSFIFEDANDGGDAMIDILCDLLRLNDDQQPMAIVQLAGFPSETMEVIVSVLFRLAFEFGIWSDGCCPLLIVCEEAHNYANADSTVGFGAAREGLSRIAKEGRKHGVFLGLVTQRPHQLDSTLISQCSTVFAMRLGHEEDQKIVRAAVSDSASRLLAFLPSLGTREALVIGAAVPTVMRLRFDELPPCFIPQSQAVWDGNLDCGGRIDEQFIASVVARWRGTAIGNKPAPQPAMPPHKSAAAWPLSGRQD
jgi:hypothetical protein